jgi:Ca-activated chloride channel homolog
LAVAALAQPCAWGGEPSSVIVVFDGSGSMWGTLEGSRVNKLTIARDGLRQALSKIGTQTQVGLAGFGHRRGDCGDVEIMLPPAPLDVDRIMGPLGPYNPKGRGPLTLALREAGKVLAGRRGRKSLVLIFDDADNCRPDLCAVAAELKAAGITAHAVGLGVKTVDLPKMACLPQITGGKWFNAMTAEQVSAALDESLELASDDVSSAEPSAAAAPMPVGAAAAVGADAPPGLYLRATLGPNTDPVAWPLHWTVLREDAEGDVLLDARVANPMVVAGPGRYVVEVHDGAVAARQLVEVGHNVATIAILVLNAGTVQVKAQMTRTGAPVGDATITIAAAGNGDTKKEAPRGPPLAVFRGSEGTALLPQGHYLVRAEEGLVRSERAIIVPAGSQGRIEVPLNGARVIVTASMHDGIAADEAVRDAVFSVVEDDPDAPKGRRELARSARRQAEFMLAPGTYYVVARQGGVEARERIALGPGDVVRRTLVLAPGRLVLSTRGATTTPTLNEPVMYRIERIDGVTGDVVTTSRPSPGLLLASGRYRVEGRYGVMNVRTIREVEVRSGQTQQLVLEPQAATLKLRYVAGGGAQGLDVFWDVRDESGRTVWTTGVAEPSATLQAGRYMVRAETRDKRYERQIDLRAGEASVVEISAD